MKRIVTSMTIFMVIILLGGCNSKQGTVYKLYYLGGQSNMDGYGYISELPENLAVTMDDVYIFHGNSAADDAGNGGMGIWAPLKPGHGAGFSSDSIINNYSDRFGIEITFASRLRELDPSSGIALLKYSRGGTSIDVEAAGGAGSWDPDYLDGEGINQYDHFLSSLKNAMRNRDIDGDGKDDILIPSGIIWMQGESDGAVSGEIAGRYYDNLSGLMQLVREALGADDIPVVIGRISDSGNNPSGKVWEWGEIIRDAQKRFADSDPDAGLVTSTDSYGYSDPWHYNSAGYIDLGRQFADMVDSLSNRRK